MEQLTKKALLLDPQNFTPLVRTPWAGQDIGLKIKRRVLPDMKGVRVGESWEFSVGGELPSKIMGEGFKLSQVIATAPEKFLSPIVNEYNGGHCNLLVKIINADYPLSIQVHPEDGDPSLSSDECGKPESWFILNAQKDAGIYLGFKEPYDIKVLENALERQEDFSQFMNFVPVQTGDYFEIYPTVPHAIGAGVTLLEPQRVQNSKSGKTYRFWDWGRRYNGEGALDMAHGKERELHVRDCLRLIDPKRQWGTEFLKELKKEGVVCVHDHLGKVSECIFPANDFYQLRVVTFAKDASKSLELMDGFSVITTLKGEIELCSSFNEMTSCGEGQTVFLPYFANPYKITAQGESRFVLIHLAQTQIKWS